MSTNENPGDSLDQSLTQRFRQMRQMEAASAPAIVDAQELLAKQSGHSRHWLLQPKPQLAVAASVLFASVVLLRLPVFQTDVSDPGALYADIMAANPMTTDQLLFTGNGITPESVGLPSVFTIDLPPLSGDAN